MSAYLEGNSVPCSCVCFQRDAQDGVERVAVYLDMHGEPVNVPHGRTQVVMAEEAMRGMGHVHDEAHFQ